MISTGNKKYAAVLFVFLYAISLLWLSSVWYNSYTSFHFFNDIFEWEYLDKLGHCFVSFHLGLFLYRFFEEPTLTSSPKKKWICFIGFFMLLPIEILDGFSLNYGASPADLLANGAGSLFCYCHLTFNSFSCVTPKFSFHRTAFSLMRPDLLGATFLQQTLKDYNGQTYWFSLDVNQLFNKKILPNWLMLTVGYGAEGLLGGHDNCWQSHGQTIDYSAVLRTKRIFISVDINSAFLRRQNKLFSYLFAPFVLLKFPAPAIEFNFERGIIFHFIYF